MKGWKRLWVLIGIPWVLYGIFGPRGLLYYYGWGGWDKNVTWTVIEVVGGWLLIYVIGLGITWVIRGFRTRRV